MPKVRIKLDPLPSAAASEASRVSGMTLRLLRRGPGTTLANRDTPQPAVVAIRARFLPTRDSELDERVQPIATISGDIALNVEDGTPRFVLASENSGLRNFAAESPLGEGERLRRLRLDLDPAQFIGTELRSPLALALPVPAEPGFTHVELEASLTVAGELEADFEVNDVLDVPLAPPAEFVLQVVDELGEPLAGVAVELSVLGVPNVVDTDASGFVRVDDMAADGAAIRFVDPEAVLTSLKERWRQPRVGGYVHAAPGVGVVPAQELRTAVLVQSERRLRLSIQPRVVQARVTGSMFDLDKSFVLPEVIPSLRGMRALYEQNEGSKLLLVGHTDTSGTTQHNDELSLERAESMAAFLRDDVATWMKRYDKQIELSRRWGSNEDLLMMSGLTPGVVPAVLDETAIRNYQQAHNDLPPERRSKSFQPLPVDGKLGETTRQQLIADYMNQDDTTLPDGVEVVTHGCGEHFPLAAGGTERDSDPKDGVRDAVDRRVELFFFDPELGIMPPPPGKSSRKDSREYPEWHRRAKETHDFEVNAGGRLTVSAFAPADAELKFIVEQADGRPLASVTREQGRLADDVVSFDFVPELLPAAVQFRVERGGQGEEESGLVEPILLRNALALRDFDTATFQVTRGTGGGGAGSNVSPALAKSASPVDANAQDFFLLFHWANPKHRFLERMTFDLVALSGSGANQTLPEAPGSKLGAKRFLIPDDVDSVRLILDVLSPRVGSILRIEQEIAIKRQGGQSPSVSYGRSNFRDSKPHPRLKPLAYSAGPQMPSIEIDLLFLDVTEHVRRGPNAPIAFSQFPQAQSDPASAMQCTYRVLEHTGGRPTTWMVALPPNLPAAERETNVLLFFRHELLSHARQGQRRDGPHRNSDEALLDANRFYFAGVANPGKYVNAEANRRYDNYPFLGWDRQLRQSGKNVVVLLPMPHVADFGVLETPSASSKGLLTSALLALFGGGFLASGQEQRPSVKRLALGAWSSGTDTLFKWAKASKELSFVDELYVFDGKRDYPVSFKDWFEQDPGRRSLHLIGTAYTEVAANRVKQQLTSPNVFVEPGNPRYWYENADYLNALSAAPPPRRFRSNPAAPPLVSDASTDTNIFVSGETLVDLIPGVAVRRTITFFSSLPGIAPRTVPNVGHEEAALFMLTGLDRSIDSLHAAVKSQADFTRVVSKADVQPLLNNRPHPEPVRSFRHRHAWSVFGGVFNDRGRPFVGYFQLCLERGRFQ